MHGPIIGLGSKEQMSSSGDVTRSVVINWESGLEMGAIHVVVFLPKKNYQLAVDAFQQNRNVEVNGSLLQIGQVWRLSAPHNFTVTDE